MENSFNNINFVSSKDSDKERIMHSNNDNIQS